MTTVVTNNSHAVSRRKPVLIIAESAAAQRWRRQLAAEGIPCLAVAGISEGIEIMTERRVDVIVIERLALESGAALVAAVRAGPDLPIILPVETGSRRPTPADCQRVLAVVQLVRPARRTAGESLLSVGKLTIDMAGKRVRVRRKWMRLPPTQYRLLLVLAQHKGEVLGYSELLKQVWGYDGDENEARELLKVHIRLIRRRLGLSPKTDEFIHSVRGFGYMLVDPEQE